MADATHDRTTWTLCLASDLLPHGEALTLACEACECDGAPLALLVVRCPRCGGLLVACDNAVCPYTLECGCRSEHDG